jgi:hypothetical protein
MGKPSLQMGNADAKVQNWDSSRAPVDDSSLIEPVCTENLIRID